MRNLFLLFSHNLTQYQIDDAKNSLKVEEFISLPKNLQNIWSNIPPELENLSEYLTPIKEFLAKGAKSGDYVLIQGDFGGCYEMVNFAKSLGLTPIHSTTTRDVIEKVVDGKVEKLSRFKHVIFRKY